MKNPLLQGLIYWERWAPTNKWYKADFTECHVGVCSRCDVSCWGLAFETSFAQLPKTFLPSAPCVFLLLKLPSAFRCEFREQLCKDHLNYGVLPGPAEISLTTPSQFNFCLCPSLVPSTIGVVPKSAFQKVLTYTSWPQSLFLQIVPWVMAPRAKKYFYYKIWKDFKIFIQLIFVECSDSVLCKH